MLIFETGTLATMTTQIEAIISDNAAVIVGVVGLVVGVSVILSLIEQHGLNKLMNASVADTTTRLNAQGDRLRSIQRRMRG
jgi:hypothetical protein